MVKQVKRSIKVVTGGTPDTIARDLTVMWHGTTVQNHSLILILAIRTLRYTSNHF